MTGKSKKEDEQYEREKRTVERPSAAEKKKDREERDAFARRLKERDARTREQPLPPLEMGGIDLSTYEAKKAVAEKLRQESRGVYAEERVEKQIRRNELILKAQQEMFDITQLSKTEMEVQEQQASELQLAKQMKKKKEEKKKGVFEVQDSDEELTGAEKARRALKARYQEEQGGARQSEQEGWEKVQAGRAKAQYGARDVAQQKYELIMDNQVEFMQLDILNAIVGAKTTADARKGGETAPEEEEEGGSESEEEDSESKSRKEIEATRKSLPVYSYREELLRAVRDNQVLIIVGETGSGKTTQIPQYLAEVGYTKLGRVGITQPRRVAAMSVAARVAAERGSKLGHEVGYSIRFEDCSSPETKIKYMTDGMLLKEFLAEPDLASYSVIMIDEAHERTLHTDILFGLVKDLARLRSDLKLLISSATLEAHKFSTYFDDAPTFRIPGRRYPVDIFYTKAPEADYLEASVITSLQIHITQALPGDVLLFLTGQEEIEAAQEMLESRTRGLGSKIPELIITPIYSALPSELQAKIFERTPPGARKLVLATNIAETSLTIDGIGYVIDCGFVKQSSYNPRSGV